MSSSSSLSHLSDVMSSSQSIAGITDFSPSSPSSRSSNDSLLSSPPLSPALTSRRKDSAGAGLSLPTAKSDSDAVKRDDETVTLILRGSAVSAPRAVLLAHSTLFQSLLAADDVATYHLPAALAATAEQVAAFIELMTDVTALTTPTYRCVDTEVLLLLAAQLGCNNVTAAVDALLATQYRAANVHALQTHCDVLMLAHTFALTELAISAHANLVRFNAAFTHTAEFASIEAAVNQRLFEQCDKAIRAQNLCRRVRPGGSIM